MKDPVDISLFTLKPDNKEDQELLCLMILIFKKKCFNESVNTYLCFDSPDVFLRPLLSQDCLLSPEAPRTPEKSASPASPAPSASLFFAKQEQKKKQ